VKKNTLYPSPQLSCKTTCVFYEILLNFQSSISGTSNDSFYEFIALQQFLKTTQPYDLLKLAKNLKENHLEQNTLSAFLQF